MFSRGGFIIRRRQLYIVGLYLIVEVSSSRRYMPRYMTWVYIFLYQICIVLQITKKQKWYRRKKRYRSKNVGTISKSSRIESIIFSGEVNDVTNILRNCIVSVKKNKNIINQRIVAWVKKGIIIVEVIRTILDDFDQRRLSQFVSFILIFVGLINIVVYLFEYL